MGQPLNVLSTDLGRCAYHHRALVDCPPIPSSAPTCIDGLVVTWSATGDRELAACMCSACVEEGGAA